MDKGQYNDQGHFWSCGADCDLTLTDLTCVLTSVATCVLSCDMTCGAICDVTNVTSVVTSQQSLHLVTRLYQ